VTAAPSASNIGRIGTRVRPSTTCAGTSVCSGESLIKTSIAKLGAVIMNNKTINIGIRHTIAAPTFRWRPDLVSGIPILREKLCLALVTPSALFHEKPPLFAMMTHSFLSILSIFYKLLSKIANFCDKKAASRGGGKKGTMTREQTTIRMPPDLLAMLKREAQERGYTVNGLIIFIFQTRFHTIVQA
jgi:hypothetical protein